MENTSKLYRLLIDALPLRLKDDGPITLGIDDLAVGETHGRDERRVGRKEVTVRRHMSRGTRVCVPSIISKV